MQMTEVNNTASQRLIEYAAPFVPGTAFTVKLPSASLVCVHWFKVEPKWARRADLRSDSFIDDDELAQYFVFSFVVPEALQPNLTFPIAMTWRHFITCCGIDRVEPEWRLAFVYDDPCPQDMSLPQISYLFETQDMSPEARQARASEHAREAV